MSSIVVSDGARRALAGGAALATLASTMIPKVSASEENNLAEPVEGSELKLDDIIEGRSSFVMVDMGDHNTLRDWFDNTKVERCNENDIPVGIIISPNPKTIGDMYQDIEYAKTLIRRYNITFPVCLNIDRIMENDKLDFETKTKFIKAFLEKASANGFYVSIHGKDTNLCTLRKDCGITNYDAFVVMDSSEIKYDGPYSLYKDQTGRVFAKQDLASIITTQGLNTQANFVLDATHTVKPGETLDDIALQYGLSVKDLLKCNPKWYGILLNEGAEVTIPSMITNEHEPIVEPEPPEISEPSRGCDISYAQGTNIDWDEMENNFDFIVIRAIGKGAQEDSCFQENYQNARAHNIETMAYCLNSYDMNNCGNQEEFENNQRAQVAATIEALKNKKIKNVFLDIETADSETFNAEQVQTMLSIWKRTMAEYGYEPGIYCNQSAFKYMQAQVDYDLTEKFKVWIAGGSKYDKEMPFADYTLDETVQENIPGAFIYQVTKSATGAGAGNHEGHLDINFRPGTEKSKNILQGVSQAVSDDLADGSLQLPAPPLMIPPLAAVGIGGYGIKLLKKSRKKS